MSVKKQLTIEIIDGVLNISIGLEQLAFAVEHGPDWYGDYKVDPEGEDYFAFGASVKTALEWEEEDGTTYVHLLLDKAVNHALEQGYEGFLEVEEE